MAMALMTIVLLTGVFLAMRPQQEGASFVEPSDGSRSRIDDTLDVTSVRTLTSDAQSVLQFKPEALPNELFDEDEARLRVLEQGGVAQSEIPDTLLFLQSLPDQAEVREMRVALIRQWAERDAPSAARWAEGLPVGGARQESLNGVALIWSNQDLTEAISWAMNLPEEGERNEVFRGVGYEAARTEPLVAMDIAVRLPASPENDALIQHAALQWAAESPEEAAQWAVGIEDEELRDRVISLVATAWGVSDPVAAGALAVSQLPPGRAQDTAVIGIVQRWAQTDPEAAANWVISFPEGDLRKTASDNILMLWTE
jgi:hypothetical protein